MGTKIERCEILVNNNLKEMTYLYYFNSSIVDSPIFDYYKITTDPRNELNRFTTKLNNTIATLKEY